MSKERCWCCGGCPRCDRKWKKLKGEADKLRAEVDRLRDGVEEVSEILSKRIPIVAQHLRQLVSGEGGE